jgi:hypothetical protein
MGQAVESQMMEVIQVSEGQLSSGSLDERVQLEDLISQQQQMPNTMFSNRIQDQILTKGGGTLKSP